MNLRTHARDLPGKEEVLQMMAKEPDRQPTTSAHFPNYQVVREWLKELGIQTKLFELDDLDEITNEGAAVKSKVVEKTLMQKPVEVLEKVEEYLGEEDRIEKADIGIVFGGRTISRAEKGAELYLGGYVPKLLMCGKSPNYTSFFDVPEAVAFKNRAIELGVSDADIYIEPNSINIADNVRSSLNLLDEVNYKYNSVIQVISWYAQRRAWCTMKKYLDSNVKLIRVNAPLPVDSKYHLGEWYKTEVGIEIVFNEFVKMKHQEVTERA